MELKYTWYNQADGSIQIDIFSEIDSMWGYSLATLTNQLAYANGQPINVRINSPGGSVVEGLAIANLLNSYNGGVTVEVVGYAASIASVIVAKAKKAVMVKDSFLMIHEPYIGAIGATATELQQLSNTAQMFEDTIVNAYVDSIKRRGKHTERTEFEIRNAMKAETWYTAEEALAMGLVDEVVANVDTINDNAAPALANYDATMWNSIKEFKNIPDTLKNKFNINNENSDTMNKTSLLEKLKNLVAGAEVEAPVAEVETVNDQITDAVTQEMTVEEMIAHLAENGYTVLSVDEVLTAEELEAQFNAAVDAKVEAIKAQLKADAQKGRMNVPAAAPKVENKAEESNPFSTIAQFVKAKI